MRRTPIDGILYQYFPSIARLLQRIEIECDEIIEEEALDLTAEDVDLGTKDVKCMAVSPRRPSSRGSSPRPCLLYTSPSPRDGLLSRMPSSA